MNVADGSIISTFMPTHTHQDWIRFLKLIHKQTPGDKDIHLILDNYSAHKTPEVWAWLKKHSCFHLHFTPTSSSWLNQVERFFRDLTDKCVRRGVFTMFANWSNPSRTTSLNTTASSSRIFGQPKPATFWKR